MLAIDRKRFSSISVAYATVWLLASTLPTRADTLSDTQVRQQMIAESVAGYPGHCPCPYNRASNGSHCGRRSAWSKAGGYAPLCNPQDIRDEMVEAYRKQHGLEQ